MVEVVDLIGTYMDSRDMVDGESIEAFNRARDRAEDGGTS